jgi:hypothetical protein
MIASGAASSPWPLPDASAAGLSRDHCNHGPQDPGRDLAEMAARATAALTSNDELLLADIVVAECLCALESFYERPASVSLS